MSVTAGCCAITIAVLLALVSSTSAINAAYFYDGVLADSGFNQRTYDGLQKVLADYPDTNLTLLFIESSELLSQGQQFPFPAGFELSDVVVCAGFQFESPVAGWAAAKPNIKFVLIDVALSPTPPNVNNCVFAEDQLGYVMGYVAGRMTTSRVVGALSGVEVPPVMRYGNGFQQGVYASCPNCKVLISYIGSFTDGDRGIYLAEQQKLLGADVMCSLAGYSGVAGVVSVANSTYMIGVDGDLYVTAFQNSGLSGGENVLFSTAKGLNTAAYVSVVSVIRNTFRSGTSLFEFSNGGAAILPCHESCALYDPFTDAATLAIEEQLKTGAITTGVTAGGPLAYLDTLALNAWEQISPNLAPPTAVSVVAAHLNDGFSDKVLYLLGSIGQAWLWWPVHRMWTQVSTPPATTNAALASQGGSSVYMFGGRLLDQVPTAELWRYDFAETGDSWTLMNSSGIGPEERGGCAMTYCAGDGFYYMFGGSAFSFFNDIWRLNATSAEWTKLETTGKAPSERDFPVMVAYEDTLIVYGGGDPQSVVLSDIFQLNLTTLTWRELNFDLPARKFHSAVIINNTIIIVGGINAVKERVNTVYGVSLPTAEQGGRLLELATFPNAIQLHGSAAYRDTVWVYGGSVGTTNENIRLNDTFVFRYSEELARKEKGDSKRALKIGLGVGLGLLALVIVVGIVIALLMQRYHLIVISKGTTKQDEWGS